MIYVNRLRKNGVITSLLEFSTGKRVFLNKAEAKEFDSRICQWISEGKERERADRLLERIDRR